MRPLLLVLFLVASLAVVRTEEVENIVADAVEDVAVPFSAVDGAENEEIHGDEAIAAPEEAEENIDGDSDINLMQELMFTPGGDASDVSFEDALLSVPKFTHPQWRWLQKKWGWLRQRVIAALPKPKKVNQRRSRRSRKSTKKNGVKGRDLAKEYKRIYGLFNAVRGDYMRGLKMKQLHMNALNKARARLQRLQNMYRKLNLAYRTISANSRKAEANRIKALRKSTELHRKRAMLCRDAAGNAKKLVDSMKDKLVAKERQLREFLRSVLRQQRERREQGLAAMDARQRREIRRQVRRQIREEKKKLQKEATLAKEGKLPPAAAAAPANKPAAAAAAAPKPKVVATVTAKVATPVKPAPKLPRARNTQANPIRDCSALHRRARSGFYWMERGGNTELGYCLQKFGRGWTYVAENGRSAFDLRDISQVNSGDYGRHIYNLLGETYHEVLVRRVSKYWCDSWGRRTMGSWNRGRRSASMGLSVDDKWFNYNNKLRGRMVRQPITDLTKWANYKNKFGVLPWKGNTIRKSNIAVIPQTRSGSVVRFVPRTYTNKYLEVENLDGILGSFGGCDAAGGMKIQVFIRPYNKAREERRLARLRRRAQTALRRAGSNVDMCCGVTRLSDWKPYGGQFMYVDINTSRCGFKSVPQYFTTESGLSSHWTSTGQNAHYSVTAQGLRVYVTSLYAWRYRFRYRIRWCGMGQRTVRPSKKNSMCCGTAPNYKWNLYSGGGHIWQDVDLRKCGFTATPQVFTSLRGLTSHWTLRGVAATYFNSKNGFRSYLYGTWPHYAKAWGYNLDWCAVGPTSDGGYRKGIKLFHRNDQLWTNRARICCGSTAPKWHNYPNIGVFGDIDTSKCNFSNNVRYFSSIAGGSNHWVTTGADAIYSNTARGYRVYIYSHGWVLRTEHANMWGYRIDWCGVDTKAP